MGGHDGREIINAVEILEFSFENEVLQPAELWTLLHTNGSFEPRCNPLLCQVAENTIMLSGGFDSDIYFSDVYYFDTEARQWTKVVENSLEKMGFSCLDAFNLSANKADGHIVAMVRDSNKDPRAIEYKHSTKQWEYIWDFKHGTPEGRMIATDILSQ